MCVYKLKLYFYCGIADSDVRLFASEASAQRRYLTAVFYCAPVCNPSTDFSMVLPPRKGSEHGKQNYVGKADSLIGR